MAKYLKSKNIIERYLQEWLDDVVPLKKWADMESVDVFGLIEDELSKRCDHELKCGRQQESGSIINKHYITYELDFSKYVDFIYEVVEEAKRSTFEDEGEFVKYKHYTGMKVFFG